MWKEEYIKKHGIEKYKEKLKKTREWKKKNKEKVSETYKIYSSKNSEKIKEKNKAWNEANKEHVKETNSVRSKLWYSKKENRAKVLIKAYQKKDKKHNLETTLTIEELINLWDNGCYWCGEKDFSKLGADRIDNNKGHTLENCVCSCAECNTKRNKKSFDEFKRINCVVN